METSRCWGKMFIPWFVGKWLLEVARWNWLQRCWSEKHLRPTFLQTLANLPSVIWSIFLISFISYWFYFFYSSRTPVHVAVITTPTPASPTGTTCHHANQTPPTSSFFPTTNGKVSSIISWEFQLAQCSINIHRKLKWHWRSYAEEQTFKTLN